MAGSALKARRDPMKNMRTAQRNASKRKDNIRQEMVRVLARKKKGPLSAEDSNFLKKYCR